jgi:hypothetical protein
MLIMKNNSLSFLCLIIMLFALVSCSKETETIRVDSPLLSLKAEGPMFEGANTASASWEFDLNELLGEEAAKAVKLKNARLVSVEITLQATEDNPSLEKLVLELTSKNMPMTRVGLYEGAIAEVSAVNVPLAAKQENLKAAFQDGRITFVCDFDLNEEEYWDDLTFTLKAVFELDVTQ